jgi:predicted metal-dependent hydrolase
MKTKWGTCNIEAGRVWLNLEAIKKPHHCIEYIIVHELAHLIERHHNQRFIRLLDDFLPQWRLHRHELNTSPLAHEDWLD